LTKRDERIDCKGKGLLTVYWCEPSSSASTVISGSDDSVSEQEAKPTDEHDRDCSKTERLIDWNVDVLTGMLKQVVLSQSGVESDQVQSDLELVVVGSPIDEISEELALPTAIASTGTTSNEKDMISTNTLSQLRELVESIASLYQQHAFHNFEHASHVAMSAVKLLDRIAEFNKTIDGNTHIGAAPGSIYGPLSRFAVVFAALIHDVEHCGVTNAQLVQEQHPLATTYAGRSVAEQHSVDMAWQMFMKPQFADLRRCLFANQVELQHFRAVVVNAVMATDLFDPELKVMRETRWNKSLTSDTAQHVSGDVSKSRAAIVLDLLIQASDVSHTMQHFTIYKKWNLCLLTEMYEAYQSGRSAKDPTIGWYDGELWFFDSYVIPLAQKLRGCQVFGVSCDEFLDYAQDNRAEWEVKGRVIVAQAKADLQAKVVQQGMGESVAI
jgi:3'5'-cyclic nucleotide phosphodiesterase